MYFSLQLIISVYGLQRGGFSPSPEVPMPYFSLTRFADSAKVRPPAMMPSKAKASHGNL
jgi:hypothetical protein